MPRGRPITKETRASILADIQAGLMSRNAIARKHELAGSVITNIAADAGVTFDRTATQAATAAHHIDLEKTRLALIEQSYQTAMDMLDDMRSPTVYNHFEPGGTKTFYDNDGKITRSEPVPGEWRDVLADEPSISDKRNLATIYGIMISKAAELNKSANAAGSSVGESLIEGLHQAFSDVAAKLAADPSTDPTVVPTDVDRETLLAEYQADHPEVDVDQ